MSEHRFVLVSEWMENGNINEFIERDQHVNRAELVRYHWIPGTSLMHSSVVRGREWPKVHA